MQTDLQSLGQHLQTESNRQVLDRPEWESGGGGILGASSQEIYNSLA